MDKKECFGMWDNVKKEFISDIKADSPKEARKLLVERIGKKAHNWKYEARKMD